MKYKKFIIENYKGITNAVEINVEKNSLIPIIGINECGKTTILNAIYAFDYMNDWQNEIYFHLNDIINLYKISNDVCVISAVINTNSEEIKEALMTCFHMTDAKCDDILKVFNFSNNIEITIKRKFYFINSNIQFNYEFYPKLQLNHNNIEQDLCEEIIKRLPYILYFDDFRETFPDEIEINKDNQNIGWLPIIQELFFQTNENFSVYELKNIEERRRKSILSQVKKKLNETLTTQWSNFRLENKEALEIDISFVHLKKNITFEENQKNEDGVNSIKRIEKEVDKYILKFDIIERDSSGNEHFFYVKNRSKGFFWFFNFVMKLEFNPDKAGDLDNAIYLLDEPGSYLHPYAQSKLCIKLKELSQNNIVIYCTHSHYLLNPETIPLNKIHIVNKTDSGEISLTQFYQVKNSKIKSYDTAFRTIYDALYIKPFDLDVINKKVLIVEGIYDYYSFKMFNKNSKLNILPGKGADSLINFISIMIAFEVDFKVIWDNDNEGKLNYNLAANHFGIDLAKKHFFLLPQKNNKVILQDLFYSNDLMLIANELNLDRNISFEKKISSLFFSLKKDEILSKISINTKNNFKEVFNILNFEN